MSYNGEYVTGIKEHRKSYYPFTKTERIAYTGGKTWKSAKSSPELASLLELALQPLPLTCQKKMMFGAPVYTVNRNMFAGIHGNSIFIRLSEAERKQLAASYPETAPFEPVKGHIMKEYVIVPQNLYRDTKTFQEWLRHAYEYASSLAPKEQKQRRTKGLK